MGQNLELQLADIPCPNKVPKEIFWLVVGEMGNELQLRMHRVASTAKMLISMKRVAIVSSYWEGKVLVKNLF